MIPQLFLLMAAWSTQWILLCGRISHLFFCLDFLFYSGSVKPDLQPSPFQSLLVSLKVGWPALIRPDQFHDWWKIMVHFESRWVDGFKNWLGQGGWLYDWLGGWLFKPACGHRHGSNWTTYSSVPKLAGWGVSGTGLFPQWQTYESIVQHLAMLIRKNIMYTIVSYFYMTNRQCKISHHIFAV